MPTCALVPDEPFSGASLLGRDEFRAEFSTSFLESTGLFGLAGNPTANGGSDQSGSVTPDDLDSTLPERSYLCRRSASTASSCASCRRALARSHRGLRCIGPTQSQEAGPLSVDRASPNPPVNHTHTHTLSISEHNNCALKK